MRSLIIIVCLLTGMTCASAQNTNRAIGLRAGIGVSKIVEEVDMDLFKWGVSNELSMYMMSYKKYFGWRLEFGWSQNRTRNDTHLGNMELNYLNAMITPSFVYKRARVYAGGYAGFLFGSLIYQPETNRTYELNFFDAGLVLGSELALTKRFKIDVRTKYGFVNMDKGTRYYLTNLESDWMRSFSITAGVVYVIHHSRKEQ